MLHNIIVVEVEGILLNEHDRKFLVPGLMLGFVVRGRRYPSKVQSARNDQKIGPDSLKIIIDLGADDPKSIEAGESCELHSGPGKIKFRGTVVSVFES